ncbi:MULTISPECIES: membrane protein insertase YidC [Aminobacter]|jgi:YidC/Oxa1 family membrane protein insertase|uniref:Membrane protein insertase YidC n=2 Tax=Aminobacter TaxID=31988 RepID=A0AAC8YU49_AMIAI|nr:MULTISPECIES: membrane protein insertase YidC [Aminobacter]AMS44333.1 insertase [Aminobacter aminovorans]MBA8908453.1 YidC/Oxa1 family membrane protein insertase [Aminobacter ciceronei]MBA9022108.1 YidC/Oxa1 family membrane protein insertase [Aminobacter ciceronei]MBB3708712.1 YidC/Oxa1 family membrane protein insertase [Aminobacter aminovorans]MRX34754.1 membrane protein insertase YidC [Aminobacter sp. MDW-2]
MENNRNFFITIALSVLILTLWQVFYMNPRVESQREAARIEAERVAQQPAGTAPGTSAGLPATPQAGVPGAPTTQVAVVDRAQALAASGRIPVDTPSLKGSINLTGARIDDISLKHYRVAVEPNSPVIELLNPQALPAGFYSEIGFVGSEATGAVPGPDTVWTAEPNTTLTPATPVTLTYTNDKGLTFKRTIAVDQNYMFTVTDTVANAGSTDVALSNYGRLTRFDKPLHASTYVLHEGLIGVTGTEGLQEINYATIEDDKQVLPGKSTDGWLGITDKYWAAALVPSGKQPFQPRFSYFEDGRPRYQADFMTDPITVAAGQSATVETLVFAGAKEVAKINAYEADRQIRQFELLIDWGWFYFITKPMFWLIDTLYKLLGNFGLAILATTVIVKAIFFPLANKSYKSMANMKMVQPKMLEIREKYADDKMKQQQAMMELYKTEKINPLAGCWPVLIQIPVFFALYKVLYVTIEMRHAPFFGWIHDLAAPDPTSLFNLFGLLPWGVPAFLMIGVWPLIMGVTMFLQMRMNPTPPDPTQAMIFTWMPILFTFMLASFPAGLVIYWAWNNSLSILQQGVIMKRQGAKIELWDNLMALFKKKPTPAE